MPPERRRRRDERQPLPGLPHAGEHPALMSATTPPTPEEPANPLLPALHSVLNVAAEFGHADTGDVPGEPPVAQHPGDA
jgi:hypothetical protein